MNEKTCCITGQGAIPMAQADYLMKELEKAVREAVADGYTLFLTGLTCGIDVAFAEYVYKVKREGHPLILEGVTSDRKQMLPILPAACDKIHWVCENPSGSYSHTRSRYIVNASDRVIAVYDGCETGETFFTLNYARELEREIVLLDLTSQITTREGPNAPFFRTMT